MTHKHAYAPATPAPAPVTVNIGDLPDDVQLDVRWMLHYFPKIYAKKVWGVWRTTVPGMLADWRMNDLGWVLVKGK